MFMDFLVDRHCFCVQSQSVAENGCGARKVFFLRTEERLAGFKSKDGKYKIHCTLVYSQEWLMFMGSLYVNIPSTNDKLLV